MPDETCFNLDEIIASALTLAGADGLADNSFEEGLAVLIRSINECKTVSLAGRTSLRRQMVGHLANRFATEQYLMARPDLTMAPITAPIFVCGMPRTGTTLLVNLLNQDPGARTLTKWEVSEPVPPAAAGALKTDPRCLKQNEARKRQVEEGKLKTNVHFEWSDEPTECVFVLMQDFKSTAWDAFLPMPEYSAFLLDCDMSPAYRWHKSVLQCLQENNKGRWTLKAPCHALFARAILAVYPDARFVWTHREPTVSVASHCSLMRGVHARYGEPDLDWIGSFYPRQLQAHVNNLSAVEDEFPDRVFHVDYHALMGQPLETMRELYTSLGLDFTSDVEREVAMRIVASPKGKHGDHRYKLEEYGVAPGAIEEMFEGYSDRYLLRTLEK